MKKQWHSIKNLQDNGQKIISAEVTLEPESCWFDGHFPGFPILPGIAQLAIVSDMLKADAKNKGKTISISEIRKVRFRQFVRPDDTVEVVSKPDDSDPDTVKFRVLVKGQIACNGEMTTAQRDDK
jgi:3-hydroxyacyl-[acyl-carrier-protein] dehydratase